MHTSQLPGGLGIAVNELLLPDESIVSEAHISAGQGLALTNLRLIKVVAGLNRTFKPGGLKSEAVQLHLISHMELEHDFFRGMFSNSNPDRFILRIIGRNCRLSSWFAATSTGPGGLNDLFQLYAALAAATSNSALTLDSQGNSLEP